MTKGDQEEDDNSGNGISEFSESSFAQNFVQENLEKFEKKLLLGGRRQDVEGDAAQEDFGYLAPRVEQISLSHDVLLTTVPFDGKTQNAEKTES